MTCRHQVASLRSCVTCTGELVRPTPCFKFTDNGDLRTRQVFLLELRVCPLLQRVGRSLSSYRASSSSRRPCGSRCTAGRPSELSQTDSLSDGRHVHIPVLVPVLQCAAAGGAQAGNDLSPVRRVLRRLRRADARAVRALPCRAHRAVIDRALSLACHADSPIG